MLNSNKRVVLLLCNVMGQGIFVLLIERATYPEKPNQIQFPKEKPPNPKNQTKSNFQKKNLQIQKPNQIQFS